MIINSSINQKYHPFELKFREDQFSNAITPKKIHHLGHHNSRSQSFLKNLCSRCNLSEPVFSCSSCINQFFCIGCDDTVHKTGKFRVHNRKKMNKQNRAHASKALELLLQEEQNKIKQMNQQTALKTTTINIEQTWLNIIASVSKKFQFLIEVLGQKKKQVIQKIQKKRDQELSLMQSINASQSPVKHHNPILTHRKSKSFFPQDFHSPQNKNKAKQAVFEGGDCKKNLINYKCSLETLEEIESIICKLDMRSIIIKNLEETVKKPTKSSLIISTTGSATSPTTRTPNMNKNQSQLELKKDISFKLNFEAKKKEAEHQKQKEKEGNTLIKVKSEKLTFKSPKNSSKFFTDKMISKQLAKFGQ